MWSQPEWDHTDYTRDCVWLGQPREGLVGEDTRIYISAPFEMQALGQQLRQFCETRRFLVVSRWLDEHSSSAQSFETLENHQALQCAVRDLEDLAQADALLLVNPESYRRAGTGGRHVEVGLALAMHLPVFILGVRSNVFHYLPAVRYVSHNPLRLTDAIREHFNNV